MTIVTMGYSHRFLYVCMRARACVCVCVCACVCVRCGVVNFFQWNKSSPRVFFGSLWNFGVMFYIIMLLWDVLFKRFVICWIFGEFFKILKSGRVYLSNTALYIWMHVQAHRLSCAMVNASDWRAKGPGFNTRPCHLHHFIVLFLIVKSVQFHKSFVFEYVFTISKLTIDEWMVWAIGVYLVYSALCIWLYVEA